MTDIEKVRLGGAVIEFLRRLGCTDDDVEAVANTIARHLVVERDCAIGERLAQEDNPLSAILGVELN